MNNERNKMIKNFNSYMDKVEPSKEPFFQTVLLIRKELLSVLDDNDDPMIIFLKVTKMTLQLFKRCNADVDKVVEDVKAGIEGFNKTIADNYGLIEMCNVALSKCATDYNFKDKKHINIEPLGVVLGIIKNHYQKNHQPFWSALDEII